MSTDTTATEQQPKRWSEMTQAERRAAYRARTNVHAVCGIRSNSELPASCARCEMIAAYRDRREMYRDELEASDAQNVRLRPIFVPTFRWWLRVYEWPTAELGNVAPELDDADLSYLDAWSMAA